MPTDRLLANLRAPDIARRLDARSIIVQPLGATEQHGPHLPFCTDMLVAQRVAEAAVARVGDEVDAWLLPGLAYTKSNEHAWSPGTIWLSPTTLLAVLDDLGRCIAMTPARRLVFLNGHGGNSALLNVANRELRLAHGLMTFLAHPGLPADQGGASPADELGMGVHGGTEETSLMLHLAPELVRMDRAAPSPGGPARTRPPGVVVAEPGRWEELDGYTDRPDEATVERGERALADCVAAAAAAFEHVADIGA